jgi:hypothetical protein
MVILLLFFPCHWNLAYPIPPNRIEKIKNIEGNSVLIKNI